MKKFAIIGAAVAALSFATPALSADVPVRGPIYKAAPAPAFNWTGLYVGGHIGYGWGELVGVGSVDIDGIVGGAQIGYNWQYAPNWVIGIETDITASQIGFNGGAAGSFDVEYFGTVRGRLGYVWDRSMLYGTGGFAYGRANASAAPLSVDQNFTGWTAGFGYERAISRNWSLRLEYLYVDFSAKRFVAAGAPANIDFSTIRFGVNYRF